jgi:hypothetical protein
MIPRVGFRRVSDGAKKLIKVSQPPPSSSLLFFLFCFR